jgi:hypothetical protein
MQHRPEVFSVNPKLYCLELKRALMVGLLLLLSFQNLRAAATDGALAIAAPGRFFAAGQAPRLESVL